MAMKLTEIVSMLENAAQLARVKTLAVGEARRVLDIAETEQKAAVGEVNSLKDQLKTGAEELFGSGAIQDMLGLSGAGRVRQSR